MKAAARIFARDLKRILTNPVAVIVAVGVCLLPSLYAWLNILANWDPYQNTGTVPIAVVVEDAGASVPGMGEVNAGAMVRERLEENHQLGWTFVDSRDEVVDGVSAGRYYAAFVIPSDFTQTLAGALEGHVSQARVAYYVNEKVNAVAPKVTDTGATTLEDQIASEFVSVAGEAVAEKLQGAVGSAASDVDKARSDALSTLRAVQGQLDGLAEKVDAARATIGDARGTVSQARGTLSDAKRATGEFSSSLEGALGSLVGARERGRAFSHELSDALGTSLSTVSGISSLASHDIGQVAGDIGWAQGVLDSAISQLRAADGTVKSLSASLEHARQTVVSLAPGGEGDDAGTAGEAQKTLQTSLTHAIDVELDLLVQLSDDALARLDTLQSISDDVSSGADATRNLASSVNDAIQTGTGALEGLRSELAGGTIPQLADALDEIAAAGGRVAGGAEALGPMIDQADGTLGQLDALLAQCDDALGSASSSLEASAARVGSLADNLGAVQSAETLPLVEGALSLDPKATGDALGSPVEVVDEAVFPVATYGSGVAPFYTNLALWVGGFVLVAIYKLEVDREGLEGLDVTPTQAFFGRWLLLALLGQIQAVICCAGDIALGVQCVSPAAFVLAGMAASAVYVLIVYALAVALKHVGKALAVLLVVLQIPGASGLYPIQMQPAFFRALSPWLPFTYGINAMREAVAGFYDGYFARDLLTLALFAVPALYLGLVVRRRLLGANALFDRKMGETDLLVFEHDAEKDTRLATLYEGALAGSPVERQEFLARAADLDAAYPRRARWGVRALLATPLVLVALTPTHPARLALLAIWVVALVVASAHLIRLEYVHERTRERVGTVGHGCGELEGLARIEREKCEDSGAVDERGGSPDEEDKR